MFFVSADNVGETQQQVKFGYFSADNVGQTVGTKSGLLSLGFAHVVSCALVPKVAHLTTWAAPVLTGSAHVEEALSDVSPRSGRKPAVSLTQ